MPCEIKELVVNTTINENNSSDTSFSSEIKESDIIRLINAEINDGSKDYDPNYIRKHVEKLTS